MDMVDIFMSRTFLAQFDLVIKSLNIVQDKMAMEGARVWALGSMEREEELCEAAFIYYGIKGD